MIIKYIAGLYAALALVVLLSARYVQQSVASAEPSESIGSREARPSPQSPFPDVCIPGVPEKGDCCLWEIVRKGAPSSQAERIGHTSLRLLSHPRTNRTDTYNTRIATSVASAAARDPRRLPDAVSDEPSERFAARILVTS